MNQCYLKVGDRVFARCPGVGIDGVLFTVKEISARGVRCHRFLRDGNFIEAWLHWTQLDPLHKRLTGGLS